MFVMLAEAEKEDLPTCVSCSGFLGRASFLGCVYCFRRHVDGPTGRDQADQEPEDQEISHLLEYF